MISFEQSGAFVELLNLERLNSGALSGLQFAVKDLIDVAGRPTGCGNPEWPKTHPLPVANAVCVDQLLLAGATCIGKTVTDELAYSLLGENYFFGTPLNPHAPDRVPGGSSSGSASAVACGLVDFALGTDTGGSVRVPASNCGIWGFRPSHGMISVAGVNPLAWTYDTVGILARDADVLARSCGVLLGAEIPGGAQPRKIHFIREAFALADSEVQDALKPPLSIVRKEFSKQAQDTSMREIVPEFTDLHTWHNIYRMLFSAEVQSSIGGWIAETRPQLGPMTQQNFDAARSIDRKLIPEYVHLRQTYFHALRTFLGAQDLLCIPTVPAPAPLKGSIKKREVSGTGYYPRALSLTAIGGVGRLPQVSVPAADVAGAPIGLSFLAANGEDAFLLAFARRMNALF